MNKPFNARQASRLLLNRLAEAAVAERTQSLLPGSGIDEWSARLRCRTATSQALDALIAENEEMQQEQPTEGLLQVKARQYREREPVKETPDAEE